MTKTCKTCGNDLPAAGVMICPACAAALADYVDKKTGVKAEIRGKVIEALKMALADLEDWHESATWHSDDGIEFCGPCNEGCSTCHKVIPAVRAALELMGEENNK